MYYNKELIPEPPKTLEEFFQISKEVSEKTDGETKGFGIRPTLSSSTPSSGSTAATSSMKTNVTLTAPEGSS